MHSFMGLWKGTKGLLFPRKAYPKLVKEWSEIERKTTTYLQHAFFVQNADALTPLQIQYIILH